MQKVYSTLAEIENTPSLVGYVRVLQRAWEEFNLSQVLCISDVPTLYRVDDATRSFSVAELKDCQRRFWNQGVASVLLIVDAQSVYLFSGLQVPTRLDDDLFSQNDIWLALFEKAKFSQEKLTESIVNGNFYQRYRDKFKASDSIDHYLSQNLRVLCRVLAKPTKNAPALDSLTAHNFICRLLFACYLVDRGICSLPETQCSRLYQVLIGFNSDQAALNYLYDLFKSLKGTFNGSMFERDLDEEKKRITPRHMQVITGFLRGDKIAGLEQSLGFWAYDFKLIPIETISGIYENFLTEADKDTNGAYYTPRFLAELTIDVAVQGNDAWHKASYLDPCCGSGVFLVTLFNRLVTKWELDNKKLEKKNDYYTRKYQALCEILRNQICGMDRNPSACLLTCFSLYVALLDSFDPSDIKTYIAQTGNNRLPRFLVKSGSRVENTQMVIPVVHEGDTLETRAFDKIGFDIIIGNPPWGGEGGRGSKEVAIKFMRRADDFMRPGGGGCLLLPSRIFLNIQSDDFQAAWLADHTLERVVQLADFRRILFPSAICPCMIVRFGKGQPLDPLHNVIYDTPKFDATSRRQGLVLITETDRKTVPQAKIACLADKSRKQAHVLWKRLFWGTNRDQRVLDFLSYFPKLSDIAGELREKKRWLKCQGIIPDKKLRHKTSQKPWWSSEHLFVDASQKALTDNLFLFSNDCESIKYQFPALIRNRENNRLVFTPPVVLISQGFEKVVFCDFPVLFQDSLQAIHGPEEDADLLLFLTAYLKSDLARYYCFHTSSIWCIERDTVRFKEVLNLPFPLPKDAPAKNAEKIVQRVAKMFRDDQERLARHPARYSDPSRWLHIRAEAGKRLREKTNELVYAYFAIPHEIRWLMEDAANVFITSATPPNHDVDDLPTLQSSVTGCTVPTYSDGIKAYADALIGTLNRWAEDQQSDWRVSATGGTNIEAGVSVVKLRYTATPARFKEISLNFVALAAVRQKFVEQRVVERFERQLIGFLDGGRMFCIVRPCSLVHWTRTAALNDADLFFGLETQRKDSDK